MRVAVLGAGTAGHMAVAQVAHFLPDASITHFYDPSQPPIGVGEGTTPPFTDWANTVLGWDFDFLAAHCDATPKAGIAFEGWADGSDYTHFFGSAEGRACHLSAAMLSDQLAARSPAIVVSERVESLASQPESAVITTASQTRTFDFVLDARGFPGTLDDDVHIPLAGVPTDAALLVRGSPRQPRAHTRAVARPYGWIFVIPLGSETAYGYIHAAVEGDLAHDDLAAFLVAEKVETTTSIRALRFPNFRRRRLVDGAVFAIGNRAAFVEPLEATSLGLIVLELQVATFVLLSRALGNHDATATQVAADRLAETIDEAASFIGWHYAHGSRYETPFWQRATSGFEHWMEARGDDHLARFSTYADRGRALPSGLARAPSIPAVDRLLEPGSTRRDTFGGFLDASFAKVGYGIGWY